MFRLWTYGFFLFIVAVGYGQIQFDAKVSDRHMAKANKAKDMRSKIQSYEEYYKKDSLQAAKSAWRDYKKEYKDSLKSVGRWKNVDRFRGCGRTICR